MKSRIAFFSLAFLSLTFLAGCGSEENTAMTESDMAEKYGMNMEEYEAAKNDAATMNMTMEQHMLEEYGKK